MNGCPAHGEVTYGRTKKTFMPVLGGRKVIFLSTMSSCDSGQSRLHNIAYTLNAVFLAIKLVHRSRQAAVYRLSVKYPCETALSLR